MTVPHIKNYEFKLLAFWLLAIILACLVTNAHCQTWTAEMQKYALRTETEFNLPHGICRAFAFQESNYRPNASRVETGYFNEGSRYYRNVSRSAQEFCDKYGSDFTTERAYQSISIGLFQIMGFNLRALGDHTSVLPRLPLEDQFRYFGKFVSPLFKKYHSVAAVAACYNTGSCKKTYIQYAKNIVRYQKQFSY